MSVRGVLFKRPPYRPRGIAFVVMATPAEAALAVEQLNNTPVGGRELMVQMAEPLPPTFGRNYTSRSVGALPVPLAPRLASTKPGFWASDAQLQALQPGVLTRSASAAWRRRLGGGAALTGGWWDKRCCLGSAACCLWTSRRGEQPAAQPGRGMCPGWLA